jgi:hypothetical protein
VCVRGVGTDDERNLPFLRRQFLDEPAAGGGNIGAGGVPTIDAWQTRSVPIGGYAATSPRAFDK